jgi:dTDP-4-amino-4,6-dideoxygalactose transaminase
MLGATCPGQTVGTFGTRALFSFQTLKPLVAGGGATVQDGRRQVRANVDGLLASEARVKRH